MRAWVVRAVAFDAVSELERWLQTRVVQETESPWRAHYRLARYRIEQARRNPALLESITPVVPPPGSPIGSATAQDR